MAQRKIQLLRSTTIYDSKEAAINSFAVLETAASGGIRLEDGEIMLARYKVTENELPSVKSVLGVYNDKLDTQGIRRKGFTLIVDNETVNELLQDIQDELDATQAGAGLGNDGSYTGYTGDAIVGTTTTLKDTVDAIITYIKTLDKNARANATTDGKVVVTVAQADGLVSETDSDLTDVVLGGYASDSTQSGAIAATDTLEQALNKLENTIEKNAVTSSDNTITIDTTGSTTDLSVNIDGTTLVADSSTGVISSDLRILKESSNDPNVREQYKLVYGSSTTAIGNVIQIYKDSALLSVKLLHATQSSKPTYNASTDTWTDIASADQTEANLALCYAYLNASGSTVVEAVPVGDFLRESEFSDGLTVSGGVVEVKTGNGLEFGAADSGDNNRKPVQVKIDSTSETFLTVGADGVKLSGVQDAIDDTVADETTRAQAAEGEIAGLVGLGGTETQRTFTPTTNYGNNAQSVAANLENIDQALSAISATVSGTAYLPSDAISVTQSQQQGHENEYTISLELSDTKHNSADAQYGGLVTEEEVQGGVVETLVNNNVLQIKNDGLYLDSSWDCGEY